MSAKSKAQRITAAIAEHHPGKLFARNRGMLSMSEKELHKIASTKEKGLPEKIKRSTKGSPAMNMEEMAKGYRVLGRYERPISYHNK